MTTNVELMSTPDRWRTEPVVTAASGRVVSSERRRD
jgi:hypothetical protein